jgi:hypothetical protein
MNTPVRQARSAVRRCGKVRHDGDAPDLNLLQVPWYWRGCAIMADLYDSTDDARSNECMRGHGSGLNLNRNQFAQPRHLRRVLSFVFLFYAPP